MAVEKIFQSKTGKNITLRRPHYKAFKPIAAKVAALLEVEFDAAMATDEFEQVLQALTVERLDDWLGEADYAEVAALWDAAISFCEFPAFFAERRKQHFEASKIRMTEDTELQALQIAAMKNSGLLPENFSLENAMSGAMNPPENLIPMPSSSTTTPPATDGTGERLSEPTTGGSSATSPKPPAGGKRSKGS